MNLNQLLEQMTPEVHATMKRVIELGRWPDQRKVTAQEREACLRAVIAYDEKYLPAEQRVGYVPPKESPCDSSTVASTDASTLIQKTS